MDLGEASIVEAIGARGATGQQLPAGLPRQQVGRARQLTSGHSAMRARGSAARKAVTTPSFSAGITEQVQYTSRPPGFSSWKAVARMRALRGGE